MSDRVWSLIHQAEIWVKDSKVMKYCWQPQWLNNENIYEQQHYCCAEIVFGFEIYGAQVKG